MVLNGQIIVHRSYQSEVQKFENIMHFINVHDFHDVVQNFENVCAQFLAQGELYEWFCMGTGVDTSGSNSHFSVSFGSDTSDFDKKLARTSDLVLKTRL